MLETEVKQTPGIKRSIEIIRSQIGVPLASGEQVQLRGSSEGPNSSFLNRERSTGMPPQPMIDTLPQAASLVQIASDRGLYVSPAEFVVTGTSQLPLSEDLGVAMDSNLPLGSEWASWSMDDSGGGFVPDMAYWTPFEQQF
jgi:hypothetical protein